jgi:hypothetical protein
MESKWPDYITDHISILIDSRKASAQTGFT